MYALIKLRPLILHLSRSNCYFSPLSATHFLINLSQENQAIDQDNNFCLKIYGFYKEKLKVNHFRKLSSYSDMFEEPQCRKRPIMLSSYFSLTARKLMPAWKTS